MVFVLGFVFRAQIILSVLFFLYYFHIFIYSRLNINIHCKVALFFFSSHVCMYLALLLAELLLIIIIVYSILWLLLMACLFFFIVKCVLCAFFYNFVYYIIHVIIHIWIRRLIISYVNVFVVIDVGNYTLDFR